MSRDSSKYICDDSEITPENIRLLLEKSPKGPWYITSIRYEHDKGYWAEETYSIESDDQTLAEPITNGFTHAAEFWEPESRFILMTLAPVLAEEYLRLVEENTRLKEQLNERNNHEQ